MEIQDGTEPPPPTYGEHSVTGLATASMAPLKGKASGWWLHPSGVYDPLILHHSWGGGYFLGGVELDPVFQAFTGQ